MGRDQEDKAKELVQTRQESVTLTGVFSGEEDTALHPQAKVFPLRRTWTSRKGRVRNRSIPYEQTPDFKVLRVSCLVLSCALL